MKYSNLVDRIAGDGADAWETHYVARAAQDRGENAIILSVGDPDLATPQPVIDRAIEALRGGDTHYTPVPGREPLREAIAGAHCRRTGQAVDAANVIFLSGAQNALFIASLCLAGPGDEVIAFEPLYPTYTADHRGVRRSHGAGAGAGSHSGFGWISRRSRRRSRREPARSSSPRRIIPSGAMHGADDLAVIGELARRHSTVGGGG